MVGSSSLYGAIHTCGGIPSSISIMGCSLARVWRQVAAVTGVTAAADRIGSNANYVQSAHVPR